MSDGEIRGVLIVAAISGVGFGLWEASIGAGVWAACVYFGVFGSIAEAMSGKQK